MTTSTRSPTYRGLARRQPLLAGLFTLFLLAQAGVPLTGGFVAKLSVFSAAVAQRQYVLALIGMLAAAIAAYVYLRIILTMYSPADDEEQPPATTRARVDYGTRVALDDRGRGGAVPRHHARRHARLREARHPAARVTR